MSEIKIKKAVLCKDECECCDIMTYSFGIIYELDGKEFKKYYIGHDKGAVDCLIYFVLNHNWHIDEIPEDFPSRFDSFCSADKTDGWEEFEFTTSINL